MEAKNKKSFAGQALSRDEMKNLKGGGGINPTCVAECIRYWEYRILNRPADVPAHCDTVCNYDLET